MPTRAAALTLTLALATSAAAQPRTVDGAELADMADAAVAATAAVHDAPDTASATSVKAGFLYKFLGYVDFPACLLYTSPSPRDRQKSRMPSSA